MGFADIFGGTTYPQASKDLQNTLSAWFNARGQKPGGGGQQVADALNQMFASAKLAGQEGTPFYESLIPSSPGALSPAAAAEKSAATDALQSQLDSAGVAQLGQLNREYGGRLPASMVQSGFGSLARAGAGGQTDIARQAIGENINLGEQGVAGLAGLTSLPSIPLSAVGGTLGASTAGQHTTPGYINSVVGTLGNAAKTAAGGIAGFSGLGGGPGSTVGQLPINSVPRQYSPIGIGG